MTMGDPGPRRSWGGLFGGLDPEDTLPVSTLPPRREHPPHVWASVAVEGDEVVVRLDGWRKVVALRGRLAFPASSVSRVEHDPAARVNVPSKLRRRGGRTGLFRLGTYHSLVGWSFWAVGLARNAVVIECEGTRFRHVVVEVADPAATVAEVRAAADRARGSGGSPA
jgi:hypothetical protein